MVPSFPSLLARVLPNVVSPKTATARSSAVQGSPTVSVRRRRRHRLAPAHDPLLESRRQPGAIPPPQRTHLRIPVTVAIRSVLGHLDSTLRLPPNSDHRRRHVDRISPFRLYPTRPIDDARREPPTKFGHALCDAAIRSTCQCRRRHWSHSGSCEDIDPNRLALPRFAVVTAVTEMHPAER